MPCALCEQCIQTSLMSLKGSQLSISSSRKVVSVANQLVRSAVNREVPDSTPGQACLFVWIWSVTSRFLTDFLQMLLLSLLFSVIAS